MGRKKNKNKLDDTKNVGIGQQNSIAEELSKIPIVTLTQKVDTKEQNKNLENDMSELTQNLGKIDKNIIFPRKVSPFNKEMLDTKILKLEPTQGSIEYDKELTFISTLWLSSIKEDFATKYATAKENYDNINIYGPQSLHKGFNKQSAKPNPSTMLNERICYEAVRCHCNSVTRQKQPNEYKRCMKIATPDIEIYEEIISQAWKDTIQVQTILISVIGNYRYY